MIIFYSRCVVPVSSFKKKNCRIYILYCTKYTYPHPLPCSTVSICIKRWNGNKTTSNNDTSALL